jgi:uncharacterized membrane protein
VARSSSSSRLPRALGVASLALGLPQVADPAGFARTIGLSDTEDHRAATLAVGVRELLAAAGLLVRPGPGWLWARVAGDAMDLALLAPALTDHTSRGRYRTRVAFGAVAAIAAVDVYAARRARRRTSHELTGTTTVRRSAEDVYAFWARLENLPTFMAHLAEVRVEGGGRSHWRATAPFGKSVEWDAETTDDVPGERLAWRSLKGADIDNEGAVQFRPAPGDRGTEVHVTLRYSVPGGKLGAAVARYFGEDPHQMLDDDLRRLKQVLETGEIVRSDGAPGGKQARQEFPQHAAQPLSDKERAKQAREEVRA